MSIQYVLCGYKGNEKAGFPGWKNHYPGREEVVAHLKSGKKVGIVPASVNLFVIDVDEGDWQGVGRYFDSIDIPYVRAESSTTEGNCHILVRAELEPVGNKSWAAFDASGDIRHANGYAIVHDMDALQEAMELTTYATAYDLLPFLKKRNELPAVKAEPSAPDVLRYLGYILPSWGRRSNEEWVRLIHAAYHASGGDVAVREMLLHHDGIDWDGGKELFASQWNNGIEWRDGSAGMGSLVVMAKEAGMEINSGLNTDLKGRGVSSYGEYIKADTRGDRR